MQLPCAIQIEAVCCYSIGQGSDTYGDFKVFINECPFPAVPQAASRSRPTTSHLSNIAYKAIDPKTSRYVRVVSRIVVNMHLLVRGRWLVSLWTSDVCGLRADTCTLLVLARTNEYAAGTLAGVPNAHARPYAVPLHYKVCCCAARLRIGFRRLGQRRATAGHRGTANAFFSEFKFFSRTLKCNCARGHARVTPHRTCARQAAPHRTRAREAALRTTGCTAHARRAKMHTYAH
eukprot:1653940-Pleurochrysis_carterae.AAC.5